jgi:hypothetical protein
MKEIRPADDMFFTVTMAEILERQGQLEDALAIYKILRKSRPHDERIAEKMEKLGSTGRAGG